MRKPVRGLLLVSMLALLSTLAAPAREASAQTSYIVVPAAAFPLGANTSYLASFGAVEANAAEIMRAPVYFPTLGLRVCRLSLWAHDFEATDVTARLVRKRVAPDGSSFGTASETLASVSSTGAIDVLRRFDTTSITQPVIAAAYFYWVELDFAGGPIQVTGLRLQIDAAC